MDIITSSTFFESKYFDCVSFSNSDKWISFQPLDRENILKSNTVNIRKFLERYSCATRMHCWICKHENSHTEQVHLQRELMSKMKNETRILIRITRWNLN